MPVSIRIIAAAALIALVPSVVGADEFILKPFSTTVEAGERFSVAVLSARIFMRSQKLEKAKDVSIDFAPKATASRLSRCRPTILL